MAFRRIAIIGAGAIGATIAALLLRAGHEVFLVGRGEAVQALRRSGLGVDGALGAFAASLRASETIDDPPDLAFLAVKSQDVASALAQHAPALGDAPLVTLANGVRADDIAAAIVGRERVVSTVVHFAANFLAPGKVTILNRGALVVGRPFNANDDAAREVAAILGAAMPTTLSNNIRGAHWMKLIVNLNNAFPAASGLPLRDVYGDSRLARLSVRAMREGLAVVDRSDVELESLPGLPVALARAMAALPLGLAAPLAAMTARRQETQWPIIGSTLQSLRRGRQTEIDYLNGEVATLGRRLGVNTPVNAAIVALVHQVEAGGRFLSSEEIGAAIDQA
jgi:2-dehydropantoate 2-reductase